jgi:hypothetical protein
MSDASGVFRFSKEMRFRAQNKKETRGGVSLRASFRLK